MQFILMHITHGIVKLLDPIVYLKSKTEYVIYYAIKSAYWVSPLPYKRYDTFHKSRTHRHFYLNFFYQHYQIFALNFFVSTKLDFQAFERKRFL